MEFEKKSLDYEEMCLCIAQGITGDDLKTIKFILRDDLGKAALEKIQDGKDLLTVLEKREFFHRSDVQKLKKLLSDVRLNSLAAVVQEYVESTSGEINWGSTGITGNYAIHAMTIVHNFVETDNYRKMEAIVNRKLAVLVKGPLGSGKSQNAFHYANKFQKWNPNAIVWRIDCKSRREMHISFASLILRLGIREVVRYSEDNILECIKKMFEIVYNKLTDTEYTSSQHLIIMDDLDSPKTSPDVHNMMEYFIIARNIYVVGTSQYPFSPILTHNYGINIELGMSQTEVITLFKQDNEISEQSGPEEVTMLAKNLDYLPLCLALAFSYIRITKSSVAQYNADWSKLQEQAHDRSPIGKIFESSYHLTIEKMEADLPENCRNCLVYIPYISHNNMPIQIIESLIVSNSFSKEADISRLLDVLQEYSLATVSGVGNCRVVSIHRVTAWFLEKRKTKDQKYCETLFLLKHFCFFIDNDARLVETMNRNIMFLEHACCLLKYVDETLDNTTFEMMVFECYLCCCVGISFHLYGNTQVSADFFFKRAKQIMFKIINTPSIEIGNGDLNDAIVDHTTVDNFLYGSETIKANSKQLFRVLTRKAREIPSETIRSFTLNKFRSSRDIRLLRKYGGYTEVEIPGPTIPEQHLIQLIERRIVMSLDDIKEYFLANLLITILFNYSKNLCYIEETNEEVVSISDESPGKIFPFSSAAVNGNRYALNLAKQLQSEIQESCKDFHFVGYVMTKRRGVFMFLKTSKNTADMLEIIRMMQEMKQECDNNMYYDFGVLKMCHEFNIHHRCMIQNIIRQCFLYLSELHPSDEEKYIVEAMSHTKEMEKILLEMGPWLVLSRFHLDIADTYMAAKFLDIEKAKHHFKKALQKPELPTRYKFKAYSCYMKFCLQQGNKQDIEFAAHISEEVLRQATGNEQKKFVIESLHKLSEKVPHNFIISRHDHGDDNRTDVTSFMQQSEDKFCFDLHDDKTRMANSSNGNTETYNSTKDETLSKKHTEQANQLNERKQEKERLNNERERFNLDKERLKLDREKFQQKEERLAFEKCRLELQKERLQLDRERLQLEREIFEQEKERFKRDKQE